VNEVAGILRDAGLDVFEVLADHVDPIADLVDLPRLPKARADAVRSAVEEEQPGHPIGVIQGEALHGEGADIVPDETGLGDAELVHQGRDVVR